MMKHRSKVQRAQHLLAHRRGDTRDLPSLARFLAARLSIFVFLFLSLGLSLLAPSRAEAAFGLTSSGGYYTVDTGAGLIFKVNQSNGDITSLKFNGVEYQDPSRFSQVNSGLGTSTVTGALWGTQSIKIEVVAGTLTHYYLARKGFNNIYMGTYFTDEPAIGLVRYIVRIPSTKLPNGPTNSDIRNNTGAVEASDVFGYANGQTRSKHYSDHRLMDFSYTGATGPGVGVFMVRSNHEGGSGGPFYRTIDNQCGDDQEIYEIVNYGEGQTEPFRYGVFNGPYILAFTSGAAPTVPIDTSWIHSTGIDATLKGWVQNRGMVTGQANGIPSGFQGVVGFANSTAQYWCTVSNGSYTSPWMIPGTYTMTLYKGELSVATSSVTVTASTTPVTQDITSTEIIPFQRWRIGEWDGTPAGFLNADKVTAMHPSDSRMSPWGPVTYTVGSSATNTFPAYQWKAINNPTTIKFDLTPGEVANHTLRVGLTCAYSGARPQINVNSWTSAIPSPSTQPDSRTLTVGTYRGNNVTYTYNIPASAFVAGTNTMSIWVVSGSGSTGFLSAGYSYDCVELDGPLNGTYRITPQHAQDKSLAVLNANPANSAQTVISAYQASANHQFLLDQQSDGSYRIRTQLTGNRCVELPFGDASDGNLIKLWDDNGNSAQRWNLVPVSGDWVKIVPQNDATKAMDVTGGPAATGEGTTVQSWTYLGGSNQLWQLTAVTPAPANVAPVAQNDSYSLSEDSTKTVAASGVLANDTDADNNSLTVVDADPAKAGIQPVSGPTHGTLVLNADGSFTYKPTANYDKIDSFIYQVTDGQLSSNQATVNLTVTPVNDAPVAKAQSRTTSINKAVAVTLTATDIEGDPLTFSAGTPAHGTLSGTAPNLTYTPATGYYGADSFTFTANDGAATSNTATVTLKITAPPTISAFDATLGPVGMQVTITGTVLDALTAVTFNGTTASFTVDSPTQIHAIVPVGATTGLISLTTDGGTVNSSALTPANFTVLTGSSISGRVTSAVGAPLAGISVTRSGGTSTTDAQGYYGFADLTASATGTAYSLKPVATGYSFAPSALALKLKTDVNITDADFVALQPLNINGRVTTDAGTGMAGVTITRTGGSSGDATAITNGQGYFGFSGVGGSSSGILYTLTPSKSGVAFLAPSATALVKTASISGLLFLGLEGTSVSGRITNASAAAVPGVTVKLDGQSPGVLTNVRGYYGFSNVADGTHTVVPSRSQHSFNPTSRTATVSGGSSVGGLNFEARFSIYGKVTNDAGVGVAGVTITAVGSKGTYSAITNSGGSYILVNVRSSTYAVTASLSGTSFNPASQTVKVNTGPVANILFVALQGNALSGRVTTNQNLGLVGVSVSRTGSTTPVITNAQGYYGFSSLANGNYTVTPTKANTAFNYVSRSATVNGASVGDLNFMGMAVSATTNSISGRITDAGGAGIPGVSVSRTGSSTKALTDAEGYYGFASVAASSSGTSYTITPTKSGYSFNPVTQSALVKTTQGAVNVNFTGLEGSITGRITDSAGNGVAGVELVRTGSTAKVLTDVDGNYRFGLVPTSATGISYNVVATKSGLSFNPSSQIVRVTTTQNPTGVDFVALTGVAISGRVTSSSGAGLGGVTLTRTGSATPVLTNALGYYGFSSVPNGSYSVAAVKSGYNLKSSTVMPFTINGSSKTAVDFSASASTAAVSAPSDFSVPSAPSF